ncbi:MAG: hypothetical protein LBH18_05900 [Spirochaetaceae bacterium]|jgi:hypothetical protein|nr:hypothetical protein [Spirochaetaceae bacterium]
MPIEQKRPAFAGPALEATGGIVIWEGNYTTDTPFSAFLFPDFSDLFMKTALAVTCDAEKIGESRPCI